MANPNSADELKTYLAMAFCPCGWQLTTEAEVYFCENPYCNKRLEVYKLHVTVDRIPDRAA